MDKIGVIHGRFQIFHNDHLKYLMAGKERCDFLVVGITNPDPTLTRHDDGDHKRCLPESNPLTYFERHEMIKRVLEEEGLTHDQFSIVPFPINFPDLYQYYVPLDAVFYLTIYDEWGKKKMSYFHDLGLNTHILWEKTIDKKGLTSTFIRNLIKMDKPWDFLVPNSVYSFLNEINIEKRLIR